MREQPKLTGRTYGELLGPAMSITDQAEADAYFAALVERDIELAAERGEQRTREKAAEIQKHNLGYYAGYYDSATMERVNRLFRTQHPVFGSTAPTPEQAFEAGRVAAARGTP